ncbi:hypothetical protein AXG89_33975 [Burkholderia sp. PAMC 26561]|nr:hypothetical protein AXG89_33975 [Burkholderia sp. PAMC 26561]
MDKSAQGHGLFRQRDNEGNARWSACVQLQSLVFFHMGLRQTWRKKHVLASKHTWFELKRCKGEQTTHVRKPLQRV